MSFKAFISYSHAADGKLAPALQQALHRFARPWYRMRTMRVFRDQTNLAASPGLWTSIQSALEQAEFFIYMASPRAAQSPWVQKEVEWWLRNRSPQTFLIILTDGELAWNDATADWDWASTTALPSQLRGAFSEEPLFTDLRWARNEVQLSLRHSQFRAAILDIAATLLNRPKDELDGDDVRQYRRTRRVAALAVFVLAALAVAASIAAYLATQQSRLATARALGARAEALLPTNPELALLLAREAVRVKTDGQAELALRQAFVRNPVRTLHQARSGELLVAGFASHDLIVASNPDEGSSVWSVASGERVAQLGTSLGDWATITHSADGSMVVIGTDEPTFVVYDAKTWKPIVELPGSRAQMTRVGNVLLAYDEGRIRRWDLPSLRERPTPIRAPDGYRVLDVTADGMRLLLAESQAMSAVIVVDADSGRRLAQIPERVLYDGDSFSPDGTLLVVGSSTDEALELWDLRSGKQLRSLTADLGGIGWPTYVAFTPDGGRVFLGNRNGELFAWDTESGEFIRGWTQHRNDIRRIEFSRDGQSMLSGGADGTVCLWDVGSGRCLVTLGGKGDDAWDFAFSENSRHFLTTHLDGTLRVWNRETWHPSLTFPGSTAAVSEDGRFVLSVVSDGSLRLWNGESGELHVSIEIPEEEIAAMAVSSAGSLFAVAPVNSAVGLWRAPKGEPLGELPHDSVNKSALAFDRAGTMLVTGGTDGGVQFWNTSELRLDREWPPTGSSITGILVEENEKRIVLTFDDGVTQARDMSTGAVISETRTAGPSEGARAIPCARDGLIVIFDEKDPELWNLASGTRVQTLPGHTDDVYAAALSPNGQFVLTGSGFFRARGEAPEDGNAVRVWDASSGRELLSYRSPGWVVDQVFFVGDGTTIFATSRDQTVRRFRCEVCLPLPKLAELIGSRLTRELTVAERAQYIP